MENETKVCIGVYCQGKETSIENFRLYKSKGKVYRRKLCRKCENAKRRLSNNGFFDENKESDINLNEYTIDHFGNALAVLSKWNVENFDMYSEKEFIEKTNSAEQMKLYNFKYSEIIENAKNQITKRGLMHTQGKVINEEGTYIIIGDSHGKHTTNSTIDLLHNVCKHINPKQIFHIGHLLDDRNDIHYRWNEFNNFTVITKKEELAVIHDKNEYNIIRDYLYLGNLLIANQDQITDYVKTNLHNIGEKFFEGKVITNLHRHEFFTKCGEYNKGFISSPGNLCEPHVVKTIKQIDFTNGYQVKQSYNEGYKQYRRWDHISKALWEQGIIIVKIFKNGETAIAPLRIKTTSKNEKVTSFYNHIITNNKIIKTDIDLYTADEHLPHVNTSVLASENHIAKKYKPINYVNLGDMCSSDSFNHHEITKNNVKYISQKNISDDIAYIRFIKEIHDTWSKQKYYILGNHDRFVKDWGNQNPQFQSLFNMNMFLDTDDNIIPMKNTLKFNKNVALHGEIRLYKAHGGWYKKLSNTYHIDKQSSLITGHTHFTSCRMGVYTLGATGLMEQEYSDGSTNSCNHSCAIGTHYDDVSFIQPILIEPTGEVWDGDIYYLPTDSDNFKLPQYELKFEINFKK